MSVDDGRWLAAASLGALMLVSGYARSGSGIRDEGPSRVQPEAVERRMRSVRHTVPSVVDMKRAVVERDRLLRLTAPRLTVVR